MGRPFSTWISNRWRAEIIESRLLVLLDFLTFDAAKERDKELKYNLKVGGDYLDKGKQSSKLH